jgi:hypothetical protein
MMKQIRLIRTGLGILCLVFSTLVWPGGGGHGGWHGGGFHGGGFHGGGAHWGYGLGLGLGYGPGYYGYGMPYYPYPYPPVIAATSSPPVYVQQEVVPPASETQVNYWYFCKNTNSYYPYVKECSSGWEQVSPRPHKL